MYSSERMSVLVPTSLDAALEALAANPAATVLAGGTDLMVEVNGGHRRIADVIAVNRAANMTPMPPATTSWSITRSTLR